MEIKIFFIIKVLVSALVIAIVTEVAKFSDKWGGLIAALPTTTFLILIWMYFEGASNKKIGNHIAFSMYFVLPTLPMFLIFPFIITSTVVQTSTSEEFCSSSSYVLNDK